MEEFALTCRALTQLEMPDTSYIKVTHLDIKSGNRKHQDLYPSWSSFALTTAKWLKFLDRLFSPFYYIKFSKKKEGKNSKIETLKNSQQSTWVCTQRGHGPF